MVNITGGMDAAVYICVILAAVWVMTLHIVDILYRKDWASWFIRRAVKTPYVHIGSYMQRFWLVPYRNKTRFSIADGCGWVSFYKRPIAFLLQLFGIAVRVHNIQRSDAGRDFHNHPFFFITIILRGGYYEHRPSYDDNGFYLGSTSTWYGPGSILFRRPSHFHRLELPSDISYVSWNDMTEKDVWTLFITFGKARNREWGFLVRPDYLVPHDQYKTEKEYGYHNQQAE